MVRLGAAGCAYNMMIILRTRSEHQKIEDDPVYILLAKESEWTRHKRPTPTLLILHKMLESEPVNWTIVFA